MSYTHYWMRESEIPEAKFVAIVTDFRKLVEPLKNAGILLADGHGEGVPEITDELLSFNGGSGLHYETFYFPRRSVPRTEVEISTLPKLMHFYFTSTNHFPYDVVVQAALIIAKEQLGDDILVSSDGRDENWLKAKQLCDVVLGYGPEYEMQHYSKLKDGRVEWHSTLTKRTPV